MFLLAQLGRELRTEIIRLEHLANLDLALVPRRIGAPLRPLDRLFPRPALPQPEARNELLGLRERTIDDRALAPRELHPSTLRARLQTLGGKQDAGLHQL